MASPGPLGLVAGAVAGPPWPVVLWPLLFGLGGYLLLTSPSQPVGRPRPDLRRRLRRLDADERARDDLEARGDAPAGRLFASPLLERLLRPAVEDLGRWTQAGLARTGLTWGRRGEETARRLALVRPGVGLPQFLGEKAAAGLVGLALFPLLNAAGLHPLGPWPAWLWLAAGAAAYLGPDWELERRVAARRAEALMELPALLDLLTIAVSAGLALEQALERVAAAGRGAAAAELQEAARALRLGGTLSGALQALAGRSAVPELAAVAGQLRAAHEQGLPLVPALAAQAAALRERKRLRILRVGGEASVRMLLPVALFIFPVLFVVLLVPAGQELLRLGG
jgi:tight adherence protein C